MGVVVLILRGDRTQFSSSRSKFEWECVVGDVVDVICDIWFRFEIELPGTVVLLLLLLLCREVVGYII